MGPQILEIQELKYFTQLQVNNINFLYQVANFLQRNKGQKVKYQDQIILAVQINDEYYLRDLTHIKTFFLKNPTIGHFAESLRIEKGIDLFALEEEKYFFQYITDAILTSLATEKNFDEQRSTVNFATLEELRKEHQKYLESQEDEMAESLTLDSKTNTAQAIEIISKFQGNQLRILEEKIFQSLQKSGLNIFKNETIIQQAIHTTVQKIVAETGFHLSNGGQFDKAFQQKVFRHLYNDHEGILINSRDSIAIIIEGIKTLTGDKEFAQYYKEKIAKTPSFSQIVELYEQTYGLSHEEALKAASTFEIAIAEGDNTKVANIRALMATGMNKSKAAQTIIEKAQLAEKPEDHKLDQNTEKLEEYANYGEGQGINIKDGGKEGKLVASHLTVNGKRIAVQDLHTIINKNLGKGKEISQMELIKMIIKGQNPGLSQNHQYESIFNHESYGDEVTEQNLMQSGFSYGIRKGTNYIKTQGWNFAKAKLSPFVNQVGNRIFGEAGKAALSTGVKKLAGTAITKLGGALTANVIPVAGQVASALMLADTVIETVGDKIPIVGKPVTNFYRGAKNSFLEILKKIGQAATALMVYLFSNPFVLFGAGSGAFVGSFIPGIGPFLGAFLGGTLGWIASQLLSGLKAVIPYTASNVAIASANTLNAVASQTGGVPSWLAATPYYAVGGLTVGTFLTMSVLMTAFSLPPFEKMNYTGIYIPNMPYAIDTSCNNKNLPEDFPKIAPVDSGQMTAGPGATTSKSQHGNAVDIGIPVGTPVKATHAGTVIFAGNNITDYGRMVQIESVNGFNTRYAHLDTIAVSKGSKVSAGQIIGTSGDTGNSTGPHLHYELNANQYPVSIVCTFADSQTAQGVNGCVDNCNYNF